jgi:TRIAD3 protein (E3 ubiquitin-protein ligase RNF216)
MTWFCSIIDVTYREAAEKLNEAIATEEGSMIECTCCYCEYPFDSFVQCSEGHLLCKHCLKSYVENTVFGNGQSAIKCLNVEDGPCSGFFPDSMLHAALGAQVFSKYSEALAKDAVKSAKINICTCYNCQLQV